jgi:enoyl-CoA hydratase
MSDERATRAAVEAAGEFVPPTDGLLYERRGPVAWLTFNRPAAHNAFTWPMYEGLYAACEHVDADARVRALVLRGAGDRAFASGTDIAHFAAFRTADDALQYERDVERVISRLEALRKPTIAMIQGYCAGGGAILAAVCDLRLASPAARFGMPIARTLGHTLSPANFARLAALIGPVRTKELVFTARFIGGAEGQAMGLFTEVVPTEELVARTTALAEQVAGHAPLTLRATKEAVRRLTHPDTAPDGDDLLRLCYSSADFAEGVAAFLAKRAPHRQGP